VRDAEIDALDEARAKEVGARIGARETTDVADAHVFCCALERRAVLITSDPSDMEALARPGERLELIAI
jgi:hypothetical protein